eukprot:scaffold6124_cov122-Cylindrotheca_fusiformis.AAC.43
MKYTQVGGDGDDRNDAVSVASSKRRFPRHRRVNSGLSEPLTASSVVDESLGSEAGDPYFVFRSDLQRKLELVDEALAEYLRVIHETVSSCGSLQEMKIFVKRSRRLIKYRARSLVNETKRILL